MVDVNPDNSWGARGANFRQLTGDQRISPRATPSVDIDALLGSIGGSSQAPAKRNVRDYLSKGNAIGAGPEPEEESDDQAWYETPIVQGIIDLISVGNYATANIAGEFQDSGDMFEEGDFLGGVGNALIAPAKGVVQGVQGALGVEDQQSTWADVIDRSIEDSGLDNDNKASNTGEAIGGFAGDVLLDPLTYASLGLFPLAKGAITGAAKAGRAGKLIKEGDDIAEQTTDRLTGAKQGAKSEYTAYRKGIKDQRQMRKDKRLIKKSRGSNAEIEAAIERVSGYHKPAWDIKAIEGGKAAQAEEAIQKTVEAAAPSIDETLLNTPAPRSAYPRNVPDAEKVVKPSEIVKDIPAEAKIGNYAKFTPVDRFVLSLEDFATTVPKYTQKQMDDINKITAATPANVENVIKPQELDLGRLVNSLTRLKKTFDDVDGKPVSSSRIAAEIRKGGKTAEKALARLPEKMKKRFELKPAVTETVPNPLGIPEAELLGAGAKAEDILDIQINNGASSDAFRIPAGSRYPALLAAMRNGEYDGTESLAKFQAFFENFTGQKFTDTASLAKAAGKYANGLHLGKKSDAAAKAHREAISESTKSFKSTAIHGHMAKPGDGTKQPAVAMMRFVADADPDNVNAYRRGITQKQGEELSEDYLNDVKTSIQESPFAEDIAKGAAEIFKKTYNKQKTPSGPFLTKEGWRTSDEKLISGEPKKEYWWTTATFIDQFRAVAAETSKILKTKGANLKGKERLEMRDQINMQMFAYIDAEIKSFGIFPYLTNMMPEKSFLVRLSGFDVLNAMSPAMRQKYIWTKAGDINNINMTMAMDVAETLIRSVSEIGYEGQINFAKIQPRVLQSLMGKFRESDVVRVIDENLDPQTQRFNEKIIQANVDLGKKYGDAVTERMQVFQNVYDDFIQGEEVIGKLAVKLMENTARSAAKLSSEIVETVAGTYTKMDNAIAQGSVGNALEILTEIPPKLIDPDGNALMKAEIDKAKSNLATPKERQAAQVSTKTANLFKNKANTNVSDGSGFDKNGIPLSQSWGKTKGKPLAEQAQANSNNAEMARVSTSVALRDSSLKDSATKMPAEQLIDIDRKDLAWQTATRHMGMQKFFNPRFGAEKSYEALTSGLHLVTHLQSNFHDGVLNTIMRKGYTPNQLNLGFKAAQAGDMSNPIAKEFKQVTDYMFDESKNNFFTRNAVGPSHMNNILDSMGVNDAWRFNVDDGPEAMSQAWKKWTNIEEPLKALEVIHSATIKASMDISMGAQYSAHFGRKSIDSFTSAEKKKWAKVDKGQNAFAQLIDSNLYYPKEIIDELPSLARIITESRSFKEGTALKRWSEQVFDPITSALKLTQTTMRPGHHVMSVLGDLMRNSLAGMDVSTKEYKQMWKIIRSRQQTTKEMSGFDQYARIKDLSNEVLVDGGKSAKGQKADSMTLIIGGKERDVSYESLFQLMEQKDIILPAHVGGVPEDLLYDFNNAHNSSNKEFSKGFQRTAKAADWVGQKTNTLANNRFIGLSKFSAERDNLMRGSLALHFMQSKRFASVEDAIEYASVQLKKWAPTAQDLSAAESKTARRVMFYYTWMRGIFPRIIESVMNRPGMSTVPSKGMYNLALSNGLEPQSIGNPFPEEGDEPKYPSWYANGVLGPQWKDDEGYEWGFNPTSPVLDVFNSLGSGATAGDIFNPDPGQNSAWKTTQTLMGMMNPAFKAVPELGMGTSMSTGAPIWDTSEYFTDMVGPVRTASRITGHNPDLSRRTEGKYAEGLGTPEEWRDNAGMEILNWASGLGFTNYNSDSAVTSAEFAERELKRNDERYKDRTEWWK